MKHKGMQCYDCMDTRDCNVMIVWNDRWWHSVIHGYDKDDVQSNDSIGYTIVIIWDETQGNAM